MLIEKSVVTRSVRCAKHADLADVFICPSVDVSDIFSPELHSQVWLTVQLTWEQRHPRHCGLLQGKNTPNAVGLMGVPADLILCVIVALSPRPESCCPHSSGERRQTYNLRTSLPASLHCSPQRMALAAHE